MGSLESQGKLGPLRGFSLGKAGRKTGGGGGGGGSCYGFLKAGLQKDSALWTSKLPIGCPHSPQAACTICSENSERRPSVLTWRK